MKRRIAAAGLAGAAVSLVGFALPFSTASAAPSAPQLSARFANATSTGEAGYVVVKAPASSSATVTFKLPALTGCTSTLTGIAPGAFIFSTNFVSASVFEVCSGGAPAYFGVISVNGTTTQTTYSPKPGDTIVTTVSQSATASKATLKDTTQKKSKTVSAATGGTPAQILVGIDSLETTATPPVQLPVPKFGTATFSAAKEDGKTPKGAKAVAVNMKTSGGVLQIQTSALNSTFNGWTETFKHA